MLKQSWTMTKLMLLKPNILKYDMPDELHIGNYVLENAK